MLPVKVIETWERFWVEVSV